MLVATDHVTLLIAALLRRKHYPALEQFANWQYWCQASVVVLSVSILAILWMLVFGELICINMHVLISHPD